MPQQHSADLDGEHQRSGSNAFERNWLKLAAIRSMLNLRCSTHVCVLYNRGTRDGHSFRGKPVWSGIQHACLTAAHSTRTVVKGAD